MDSILSILEQNALATPEQIAELTALPVEEVRKAIAKLEHDKIILGYRAVIDNDRADRQRVRAVIEVKVTPERDGGFDRLARRIAKFREVESCILMSGTYDLLVIVEGKDLKEVARFVSEKLATLAGVLSTATHFMLKPYKVAGTLFIQDEQQERLSVSP